MIKCIRVTPLVIENPITIRKISLGSTKLCSDVKGEKNQLIEELNHSNIIKISIKGTEKKNQDKDGSPMFIENY